MIASISIPDSVVELGEGCFSWCQSLLCVTFGSSSRLERICDGAFYHTGIESLSIPDSVVELGEQCFYECMSLRRVTFGISSMLERIGGEAFDRMILESVALPDSVVKAELQPQYGTRKFTSYFENFDDVD